jgi:uncharacterized protein (TIGR03437 family)
MQRLLTQPGPRGAVTSEFEYWAEGDRVYYRHLGSALTPFRELRMDSEVEKLAATDEALFVWLGGAVVLEFPVDRDGPGGSGYRISARSERALRALSAPAAESAAGPETSDALVTINPDRLLVVNGGVGIANGITGESVSILDTGAYRLLKTVSLTSGDGPNDIVMAPDNSRAYIANYGCSTCLPRAMALLDPSKMELAGKIENVRYPWTLAASADGTRLYSGDVTYVKAYDTTTLAQVAQVDTTLPVYDLALTADGKKLFALTYYSGQQKNRVSVVDTKTMTVTAYNDLPYMRCFSGVLSPDEKRLYVACLTGATIYVIDTDRLTITGTFTTSPVMFMAASPDGKRLYVTHPDGGVIEVLDPSNGNQIKLFKTGVGPWAIALNKAGTRGYVANFLSCTVTVLDLVNDLNISDIAVGPGPLAMALTNPGPQVSASPQSLVFAIGAGLPSPPAQTVALTVDTTGTFTWSAAASTVSGGNWLSVTPATGSFPGTLTVSVSTASLAAGNYSGAITLTAANVGNSPLVIAVALRVTASGTLTVSPAQLSFQGLANDNTLAAQTAQITGSPGSLTWTAATTSPWIVLGATSGTTPSTLSVAANPKGLIAGRYEGTVNITSADAANSPQSFKVVMTLLPGPTVPTGGLVNAASFAAGAAVAAGSLASVFGSSFGPTTPLGADKIPLPTVLGEVKVLIGGTAAPLIFASDTQINCQVPFELAGQTTATLVVQRGNVASATVNLSLAPSAPGIFTATLGTRTQGAILNANSSLNTTANPARPGEIIQIFATGQGAVSNTPATGAAASSSALSVTTATPTVLIGGKQANVVWSGLTPGLVGLWQVNAVVPADVTPGDSLPVQIVHGNALSNTTVMAVAAAAP